MATGVKPRDEEEQLTRGDIELLEGALKDKQFRKLFADYCEEIRDPENQALYQREMTQLEKERGVDVTFVNPQPGYVIKTSVAGDRKAFVNICSSETAGKPACSIRRVDGRKGLDWQIPYSLIPPREEYDRRRRRCVVYDVVFHPDTLRMAANNARFRELVNTTALDALQNTYGVELDRNNFRFPRAAYKGFAVPAVIRKPDPDFVAREDDDADLTPDLIEKLYPQRSYQPQSAPAAYSNQMENDRGKKNTDNNREHKNPYTTPKYVIRQQKNVDIQDFTYDKSNNLHSAIPTLLAVEVNLPLVCSTADCTLDVHGKNFSLVCEKPAKYKLNFTLPYSVDDERGDAKFDKSKRLLLVTLPVLKSNFQTDITESVKMLRLDSGVESEENSMSTSDEDTPKVGLVVELDTPACAELAGTSTCAGDRDSKFLEQHVTYVMPSYTHNVLDDTIAFTFHVKNTDPDSVVIEFSKVNVIRIKFTSIGAGYVPVYYSALLKFEEGVSFENVSGEAWDNNVILQLESSISKPASVLIGLHESSLICEQLSEASPSDNNKPKNDGEPTTAGIEEVSKPVIQVSNMFSETTVTVTSNDSGSESSSESAPPAPVWKERSCSESSAKGILRKPMPMPRSLSESSACDVASSIDYISSDCIPEESSLKKTVRFNEVIARQFYRYNSSIEGQKKKNQRKKSKKRNLERRKSESEAEDEVINKKVKKAMEKKPDASEKIRRDSGLADTSDADNDDKKPSAADTGDAPPARVQHKPDFYDPTKLNKGKYLEVNFKNDLIFDLDI